MKADLYLNLKKIEILSTEKIDVFRLGDDSVESFIFPDSKIEVSRECGAEINGQLVLGRREMSGLTKM